MESKKAGIRSPEASEIILVAILFLLLGFTRIYFGGGRSIMVVWKTGFTYRDTLVDLNKMLALPPKALKREHPAVYYQLIGMDILDQDVELQSLRDIQWRQRMPNPTDETRSEPSPVPVGD